MSGTLRASWLRDRTAGSSGPGRSEATISGGSAGGRAETSASCWIVATAYQGTLGGFDGKSRDEFARA